MYPFQLAVYEWVVRYWSGTIFNNQSACRKARPDKTPIYNTIYLIITKPTPLPPKGKNFFARKPGYL